MSEAPVAPLRTVRKAKPGQVCQRERGYDSGGRRLMCPNPAVLVVDDQPLCKEHAEERMTVLSLITK